MILHWALFLIGGFLAGGINAIAGGGAIMLFPLLIGAGVPAVMANTTMSLAVFPGSLTSVYGYRERIRKLPRHYFMLLIPCFIGSMVGAVLLLDSSGHIFKIIAPLFMIFAVFLLIMQPRLHKRLYRHQRTLKGHHFSAVCLIGLIFLVLSAYGGYFGAGFGVIVLSLLALTPLKDIQQINGLKNLIGVSVGIADCTYFAHRHVVDWHVLPFLVIGGVIGAYVTSTYGSKLPAAKIRIAIIFLAAAVTVYLCYKFYA
jgi:uncharacterized membrane protein YfcA